jgi:hypothetical protein
MTEPHFDPAVVKTRTAEEIKAELDKINQRAKENEAARVKQGEVVNFDVKDSRVEEVIIEDPLQPIGVSDDPLKVVERRTEIRDGKPVIIEVTRLRTRVEQEREIVQILKDCGADSMQQIKGLARIQGIIWG